MAEPNKTADEFSGEDRLTELVSYLDGELDDTQMNQVEMALINDPDLRSHADILSRTWSLLDELEQVSASEQFTQETLQTIALQAAEPNTVTGTSRWRRIVKWMAVKKVVPCFLLGLVATACGLWLNTIIERRRGQQGATAVSKMVMEHFELLRHADLYSVVPDVDQLRQLSLPDDGPEQREPEEQKEFRP